MSEYSVILFRSTGHAIRAERVLQMAGISSKLIPVPRHISSNCGVCLRIDRADEEAARVAMDKAGVENKGIHPLEWR